MPLARARADVCGGLPQGSSRLPGRPLLVLVPPHGIRVDEREQQLRSAPGAPRCDKVEFPRRSRFLSARGPGARQTMKMKRRRKPSLSRSRTSPATLATVAGAAVCLSAVSNDAAAVYGAAGNKVSSGFAVSELGSKIRVSNSQGQVLRVQGSAPSVTGAVIARNGTAFGEYDAGAKCSTALSWGNEAKAPAGGASKYIKIRFNLGTTTVYGSHSSRRATRPTSLAPGRTTSPAAPS